ncbi:MAG: DNA photolyase [Gammaproteobacteria bacterium]|nr:DNA photolyase [Gammaproteobacteria bacterium]
MSHNNFESTIKEQSMFRLLTPNLQEFLYQQAQSLRLSMQDCRQACEIALDFQMWGGPSIVDLWPVDNPGAGGKVRKQQVMTQLRAIREDYQNRLNQYAEDSDACKVSAAAQPASLLKPDLGLGRCPVASPRTLCCNLQTLDAVDNCGYGCSYCSIQSFFDGKKITFDKGFADKLKALQLDPQKTYHIGTGQSSDSLMWGNSHGVLDALIEFANDNPNVIIELKTKSANVSHLLRSRDRVGRNIICTWSLNTPTIIRHEEHGTATLEKRLAAARKVADAGYVVGFHFHPMVHYENWQRDYGTVVETLMQDFRPEEVALVSMGTLTFIKPVLREIRKQAIPGQILKMPMVDAAGKKSYPDDTKLEMFSHLYECFDDNWQRDVFFYLCMENAELWEPVLGFKYDSNEEFEGAMKAAYMGKIGVGR